MTSHQPAPALQPLSSRYKSERTRLRDWRPGLIRAALKARWGDRYDTEHSMLCTLTGYDPVSLRPVAAIRDNAGDVLRYETTAEHPVGAAIIADHNVAAAHITADLILKVAGELAADQIELVVQQYALRCSTTPVIRRDDAIAWFTRRADTLRNEARRIDHYTPETHTHGHA